jgi:hypothetical protein
MAVSNSSNTNIKVILNIKYFIVTLLPFDHMVFMATQHAYQTRLLYQCKFHDSHFC